MKNSTILIAGTLVLVVIGAYVYLKGKKSTTPNGSPSGTSSAVDSSLGLSTTTQAPAKATIDNVVSAFAETQTENYKKAKVISKEVEAMVNNFTSLEKQMKPMIGTTTNTTYNSLQIQLKINTVKKQMSEKTSEANALGYKILPYGEIEKM
jgi:hypothetical protein